MHDRPVPATLLTVRELEVTRLIALGQSTGEIASLLGIRPRTVSTHRAHVFHKLHIRRVAELVHYAVREQIIQLD